LCDNTHSSDIASALVPALLVVDWEFVTGSFHIANRLLLLLARSLWVVIEDLGSRLGGDELDGK
jgi:hypothetical protein